MCTLQIYDIPLPPSPHPPQQTPHLKEEAGSVHHQMKYTSLGNCFSVHTVPTDEAISKGNSRVIQKCTAIEKASFETTWVA